MENYQNTLFPYAYNVLGSSADAKDAIQEVITKYVSQDTKVNSEKSYLIRAVINQSINVKKKQKRKTNLADTWLPEPIGTTKTDDNVILEDILSYSLLFLLEQLNPKERAVFILKEAFAYPHKEIAEVLSISVVNSRKLLSRARQKVHQTKSNIDDVKPSDSHHKQVGKYITAIRNKDTEMLQNMLSDDVTYYADGGKEINVVKKICTGNTDVSDLLVFTYQKFQTSFSIRFAKINHQPALLFSDDQQVRACQVYQFDNDNTKIKRICTILDPDKLKNID